MEAIHCIGDSHSCFFYGQDKIVTNLKRNQSVLDCFRVYHIGPALAYRLLDEGSSTGGREKILATLEHIPKGSKVLLCFGEIDCRCHILSQASARNLQPEALVRECAERYFQFALEVQQRGYDVFLWGVVASAPDTAANDPRYPRSGTCIERNRVGRAFNENLQQLAEGSGVQVISILDHLVDAQGASMQDFFVDDVHLSQRAMPFALREIANAVPDVAQVQLPQLRKVKLELASAEDDAPVSQGSGECGSDWQSCCLDDLARMDDNSVDEIFSAQLGLLDPARDLLPALQHIHRVIKPMGLLRASVPDLYKMSRLVCHPDVTPQQQFTLMRLMYSDHICHSASNKAAFTIEFAADFARRAGFSEVRAVSSFDQFRAESICAPFGQNLMLNIEALK